jgi:hypothetical protein
MGYGRFDGVEAALVMTRLYASARLYVNFFQPSFKLKDKRREGAKVIKRYHAPSTPYEQALAHLQVPPAVKQQLREQCGEGAWLRNGRCIMNQQFSIRQFGEAAVLGAARGCGIILGSDGDR